MKTRSITHRILVAAVLLSAAVTLCAADNAQYVDPTIGNVSRLLVPTFPTYHLPNQMIRMFPISKDYIDDQVTAFPFQVVCHRDAGIMRMSVGVGELTNDTWKHRMTYDHDLETRHPWLYSTLLDELDVTVSFAPGEKCAIYKVAFPDADQKHLLIKGARPLEIKVLNKHAFSLEEPLKYTTRGIDRVTRVMAIYCYAELVDHKGRPVDAVRFQTKANRLSISLEKDAPSTVQLKYAISYISHEQAKQNFDEELASVGFEKLTRKGKTAWDRVLDQIKVKGGTKAQKRTFYTALYRTYERMINVNEGGRYYSGYDGKVHESDQPFYVDDWVWDSFLAHHPLRAMLNPEQEGHMLDSYVKMYEQSGWMPTFPQVHGNHMCMNCFHSSAIFLDGYRKGIRDYDINTAYEGIKKNLTEATMLPWRQGIAKRPIDDFYHEHGFLPALHPDEKETEPMVDRFEKRQSVAVTLGMSYDAWVLSQLAQELDKKADEKTFAKAGLNYQNLWDSKKQLFMPKDKAGKWININPKNAGGMGGRDYYDENNGWTFAWQVQHDIDGLIALLGSKDKAEARLDQLFREPIGQSPYAFNAIFPDSTSMVGQFSMGNEPSFHIPYLYNYFGAPWKTQKRIRLLLDLWFQDNVFGIPGDEDGGGMTAFVVFSQMGFYPMVPGLPYYTIGSPVFEKVSIKLKNRKTFTVVASGASKENKYISKASLNGKALDGPFFTHEDLMTGGTLKLVMTDRPNKTWGAQSVPPMK
ncbi:MAG: glycoside hydrolase family 92 protein [Planctomycetes bacterium]|nr:glycoside hydrolase family 92 protein [Planctomycetota bacterium]